MPGVHDKSRDLDLKRKEDLPPGVGRHVDEVTAEGDGVVRGPGARTAGGGVVSVAVHRAVSGVWEGRADLRGCASDGHVSTCKVWLVMVLLLLCSSSKHSGVGEDVCGFGGWGRGRGHVVMGGWGGGHGIYASVY